MLATRIATALVLLAIVLPTIFVFPPVSWGLLTLVLLGVAAWEWIRMLTSRSLAPVAAVVLVVASLLMLAWRDNAGGFNLVV
ncbi:MAG: phosphatidate cytidylyltransferase, partial [Quisquiliibacterium sp.]